MYRVILSAQAKKEYQYFIRSGNKVAVNKILSLLEDIAEHPYTGIGKPEPLKYELAGYWSRRINSEHRIVYSVDEEVVRVYVLSMRYHYAVKLGAAPGGQSPFFAESDKKSLRQMIFRSQPNDFSSSAE